MATNFSKYTSKKLNKMLETGNLSAEDKNAIINELAARETAEAPTAKMGQAEGQVYEDPDIDDATRQAWAEAEKTGGKVEKKKLNEEELMKLAEEVRANVGHKCLVVVPSISINPVNGVIKAVVINKAAAQVFYTVVLESGKTTSKAWNSPAISISDEVVELPTAKRNAVSRELWSEEKWAEVVDSATQFVGRTVTLEDGTVGRIKGMVADKRSNMLLLKIEVVDTDEPTKMKFVHRVHTSTAITINPEDDDQSVEIREKFVARKFGVKPAKATTNPEEILTAAQEKFVKAQEALEKAQARLEKAKEDLDKASAAYSAYTAAQESESGEPESESGEPNQK